MQCPIRRFKDLRYLHLSHAAITNAGMTPTWRSRQSWAIVRHADEPTEQKVSVTASQFWKGRRIAQPSRQEQFFIAKIHFLALAFVTEASLP